MKTNKVTFILPGFLSSPSEYGYQSIGNHFKNNGYKVVYVEITWQYKRTADYLVELQTMYFTEKGDVNILFGFSYGALIAYLSSPLLKPDCLYLCSMAPYFKEDLKSIPIEEKKEIGKKRWTDIEKYRFDEIAKKITCPTTIFFGANEQAFVKRRAQSAKEKIKNIKIIEMPNAGHNISNDRYLSDVKKEINKQIL